MKMRSCVLTMCVVWAMVASETVHAGSVVVSNIGQSAAGADTIVPYDPGIGQFGFTAAQEINTGSLAGTTAIGSVIASVGNYFAGTNSDFQLTAMLEADSGGMPSGPALVNFSFVAGSIPTSGFANVQFNPIGSFVLASNTNYWFVLNGSSPSDGTGSVDWQFTNSTTTVGPGSLPQFNNSFDGGTTWNGPFGGQPYLIQVNGVPEPAGWVLASIGFAAVLGVSRLRLSRRRGDRLAA
jgi:hypothetical protein